MRQMIRAGMTLALPMLAVAGCSLSAGIEEAPRAAETPTTGSADPVTGESQGHVTFEYLYGDSGWLMMLAGSQSFMVWEEFPRGAERYEFVILNYQNSGRDEVIGIDATPDSGVTLDWLVPEQVSGILLGRAIFADGTIIQSRDPVMVASREAPPEGVCSVQSSSSGAVLIHGTPDQNSTPIAEMYPGAYAQVYGRHGESWYLIDMMSAFGERLDAPPNPTGWVWAGAGIIYHGPCDSLPEATPGP